MAYAPRNAMKNLVLGGLAALGLNCKQPPYFQREQPAAASSPAPVSSAAPGSSTHQTQTGSHYEQLLRQAGEIVITERVLNIGKDYVVSANGQDVARVSGEDIKLLADVFELRTLDGKLLASEREHKRWGRLSRNASVYDGTGRLTGYIGEETIRDLFSLGYIFHFYDASRREVGKSRKIGKSAINFHTLTDAQGNDDYEIDKQFAIVSDTYVLRVKDPNSSIPLEHAILLVCIEDAIADGNE